MLYNTQIQLPNMSSSSYIGTTVSINYHAIYLILDVTSYERYSSFAGQYHPL